jgi:hypothetical protein
MKALPLIVNEMKGKEKRGDGCHKREKISQKSTKINRKEN